MVGKVIGIDFGSTGIKFAEVKNTKGVFTVEKQAYMPIDPKTIIEGKLDPEKGAALASQIKIFLAENKFTTKSAIMGLNSVSDVLVNRAITNWHAPKEYNAAILNDIVADKGLLIGAPSEGLLVNPIVFNEITEGDDKKLDVLICGVNQKLVEDQAIVLKKAGLNVVGADLAALAALRATRTAQRDGDHLDILVDIGHDVVSVLIHESGKPYSVTLQGDYAGNRASDMISHSIEDDDARTIDRLKTTLSPASERRVREAVDEYIVRVSEGIMNAILSYAGHQQTTVKAAGLTLLGGGALLTGLDAVLEERFDMPVRIGEFDPIIGGNPERFHIGEVLNSDYMVAVGLGMGAAV
jgi:type IV pilus assembly protein PilM